MSPIECPPMIEFAVIVVVVVVEPVRAAAIKRSLFVSECNECFYREMNDVAAKSDGRCWLW